VTSATAREQTGDVPGDGALAVLRKSPRTVRYLLLGVLINQMGAFIQAFLVLYLLHQGFTEQRASVALGGYAAGAVLGSLAGGELLRRLGPRTTIVLSMFCSAALVIAVTAVSDPAWYAALFAVTVFAGVAGQTYRPAATSMLSDLTSPDAQVMTMSLFRIAMNTGGTLGPLLAAWLVLIDWNLLFWVNGLTALSYGLIAVFLLPRTTGAPERAGGTGEPSRAATDKGGYARLLGDTRFRLYLLAMGCSALIYAQYFAVLPLKLTEDGHSTTLYSAVLTLSSAMVITCELYITKYVQRWRAAVAAGTGLALLGLGLAGYALPSHVVLILLATVVGVLGQIINGPTMFAHPARMDAEVKGRGLALSQATWGAGTAVGPVLGVLLWSWLGNGIWLACGFLGFLAAAAGARGLAERQQSEPS
jgi:MFS family permease